MIYLSFIWHMHQPYYNDLLNQEGVLPWVRLHGIKDYLDMVEILENYPNIHQTFNLVPSLIEQIDSYINHTVTDKFFKLSQKTVDSLTLEEKHFITSHFFMADVQKILAMHPRYYELYQLSKHKKEFSSQDILDLQVWFNLAWFDPSFRENIEELNFLTKKARYFNEEEKNIVLEKQIEVLKNIIPTYKNYQEKGQIEVSISPFYHPILPLLYNSNIAKEANKHTILPERVFSYPQDCNWHIKEAVDYYKKTFNKENVGMWPSEQAVSNHIMPLLIENGIKWIVADEAIIHKTLNKKKRDSRIIYKPYTLEAENGKINILFRDRNLSDLIGFQYQHWDAQKAADDFMHHLKTINEHFKNKDCFIAVALDGENAWEYYKNDGRDFLIQLYSKISDAEFIKTVTVSEYLDLNPQAEKLNKIASGSWICGDFLKWIGNPVKNKAWVLLLEARELLEQIENPSQLAWKQMHILEGSDWFWWYGDKQRQFDELFRIHLKNFYKIINKSPSVNLDHPLE